jgi:hypothetical protein
MAANISNSVNFACLWDKFFLWDSGSAVVGIDPAKDHAGAAFTQIVCRYPDRLELKAAGICAKQMTDIIDVRENEPGWVIPISIDHK